MLFDFDGTLVDFVGRDILSLRELHGTLNDSVEFSTFLEVAVEAIEHFHGLVKNAAVDPLSLHTIRLQYTCNRLGIVWKEEFVDCYTTALLRECHPFPGATDLLTLVCRQFKTGLLTNAYDAGEQWQRIRCSGMKPYFDVVVIAGEVGFYKPDPKIFNLALDRLGVSPEKAIFVGDSVKHDIEGAKAAGLKTVLVRHNAKQKITDKADWVIDGGISGLHDFFNQLIEYKHDQH